MKLSCWGNDCLWGKHWCLASIDIAANLWNLFNRIRIIMGEFGCTQIRTSSSYSFERKKDFGNLFYHKIYHSTIFSLDVCSGPMWPKKCMMWDFIYLLVTQSSTSAIFYFHCSCHCRLLSSLLLHCAVYGLKEETTWKLENMHCIALHWPNHFCKCWAAISEDECVRENDIQVIVIRFSISGSNQGGECAREDCKSHQKKFYHNHHHHH